MNLHDNGIKKKRRGRLGRLDAERAEMIHDLPTNLNPLLCETEREEKRSTLDPRKRQRRRNNRRGDWGKRGRLFKISEDRPGEREPRKRTSWA